MFCVQHGSPDWSSEVHDVEPTATISAAATTEKTFRFARKRKTQQVRSTTFDSCHCIHCLCPVIISFAWKYKVFLISDLNYLMYLYRMILMHNSLMKRYEKELKTNVEHVETITTLNVRMLKLDGTQFVEMKLCHVNVGQSCQELDGRNCKVCHFGWKTNANRRTDFMSGASTNSAKGRTLVDISAQNGKG